jgi:hypothetical protein
VADAVGRRRSEIDKLVGRLSPAERRRLSLALGRLNAAAREAPDDAWALGWPG